MESQKCYILNRKEMLLRMVYITASTINMCVIVKFETLKIWICVHATISLSSLGKMENRINNICWHLKYTCRDLLYILTNIWTCVYQVMRVFMGSGQQNYNM